VDPLAKNYPQLTSYQFASNSPISGIDQDGKEFLFYNTQEVIEHGTAKLKVTGVKKESSPIVLQTEIGHAQGPDIPVNVEKLGIQFNFVEYKGDWVTMPKGYSADNLPPVNSPAWNKTVSYSDVQDAFQAAVMAFSLVDVNSIKNGIAEIKNKAYELGKLRRKAVRQAWRDEAALVRETGQGTRRWSRKEKEELLNTGKVKGYEGHHINSINGNEELAGDPNNIKFVKGRQEHIDEHGGNFKNSTQGELIDRKQMINDHKSSNGSTNGNN